MTHVPAEVRCTRLSVTVQLPLAENVTAKPEDDVALTVKSGSPKVLIGSSPNLMVCTAWPMVKFCSTLGAAAKMSLPGCKAVMKQMPAPVMCTVAPFNVQLPSALKLTGNPEDAVAFTVKS